MKNVITSMLEHPIATVIVVGCFARGVATIVSAVKGNNVEPVVKVIQEKVEE